MRPVFTERLYCWCCRVMRPTTNTTTASSSETIVPSSSTSTWDGTRNKAMRLPSSSLLIPRRYATVSLSSFLLDENLRLCHSCLWVGEVIECIVSQTASKRTNNISYSYLSHPNKNNIRNCTDLMLKTTRLAWFRRHLHVSILRIGVGFGKRWWMWMMLLLSN